MKCGQMNSISAKIIAGSLALAFVAHASGAAINNNDVVQMVSAGLSEATVMQAIDSADQPKFDTSAAALIRLKKTGA